MGSYQRQLNPASGRDAGNMDWLRAGGEGACRWTSPERRVWAAVLAQALRDYLRMGVVSELDHGSACMWFARVGLGGGVGSLDWVCDQLDIDAAAVLRCLRCDADGIRARLRIVMRNTGGQMAEGCDDEADV